MKFDVITIVTLVFTLGVFVSTLDFNEAFASDPKPRSELQQGTTLE